MGTTAACFQRVKKVHCDRLRLNINLRTGIKTSRQPFMMKCHKVQQILMAVGAS